MNKPKKIPIQVTQEEHAYITAQAEKCGMALSAYVKHRALDKTDTVLLQKEASSVMCDLYRLSDLTENMAMRTNLKKDGDRLCRCLRW